MKDLRERKQKGVNKKSICKIKTWKSDTFNHDQGREKKVEFTDDSFFSINYERFHNINRNLFPTSPIAIQLRRCRGHTWNPFPVPNERLFQAHLIGKFADPFPDNDLHFSCATYPPSVLLCRNEKIFFRFLSFPQLVSIAYCPHC